MSNDKGPETNNASTPPPADRLFIPDLCAPYPVLLMVLLSELLVMIYVLASTGLLQFDWSLFGSSSLLVQWIVLLSALLLCSSRQWIARLSLPLATAVSLAMVAGATALTSYLAQRWLVYWPNMPQDRWWILSNLLIAVVLTSVLLRYFYLRQQLRLREQSELQARLDSLRARIRPHFLFNTLNSIASLIASRPEVAEKAVEDLAELFRATLKESPDENTVADELRLTELYLEIEELRLGDRLQVAWDVDDAVREAPMPALILQPLVENAVYHGISRLPGGGTIGIHVRQDDGRVHATITNPVNGDAVATTGNHMALDNIEQRIQAVFGDESALVSQRDGDTFTVELNYRPSTD